MSDPIDRLNAALEGRYTIQRELGQGGMATVYLATDVRHDRKVAVKVLKPELAAVVGVDRFLVEIQTTANLQHAHILPLFDSGEAEGFLYYVMPFVEGESLRDRIDREGQLPVDEAVRIATAVANALQAAHDKGVIHRDIKPANILLGGGEPLVADFGIALAVGAAGGGRLAETGLSLGTPHYMSPEQATGDRHVGPATDIYALGCVLYEMLTGRAPFDAPTAAAIVARRLTEDPAPVTRDRPAAAGLEPILGRALAPLPADRYGTAGEFARALRSSTPLDGLLAPGGAAPGDHVEPSGSGRRRAGLRVALTVATLAVAAVAAVYWIVGREDPETARGSQASPLRPSLAVLPFDNLSPDPDNAYLAAGINAEIHTQLSKIDGIRLVGRPSAQRFDGDDADLPAIAEELDLSHLLGGSVQRVENEVRITVHLYDAAANEQLWGEGYEGELTDIFEIQTEVAIRVADALRGVLTTEERAQLARALTDSPAALEQYLLGNSRWRRFFDEEDVRAANDAFERAVELDPGFIAAWSKLTQTRLQLVWLWGEPQERARARAALQRLGALAPDSPEHRMARAVWLYWGVQRYEEALDELDVLGDLWPGDVNVLVFTGAVQRRLGRWDQALGTLERALELDPYNGSVASNLAQFLTVLRRFDEAEPYARLAVSLNPTVEVEWWHLAYVHMLRGDWERAGTVVDSAGPLLVNEDVDGGGWWAGWQVLSGNVDEMMGLYGELYRSDPRLFDGTWGRWWDLGLAGAEAQGDTAAVRTFAEDLRTSAEAALSNVEPDDTRLRNQVLETLAVAEAYLGNDDEALQRARDAAQPLRLAKIHELAGRQDAAVDVLSGLLSNPGEYTIHLLQVDPRWAPLRGHPGFEELLAVR
jgi:serine/threonine-protein kinase